MDKDCIPGTRDDFAGELKELGHLIYSEMLLEPVDCLVPGLVPLRLLVRVRQIRAHRPSMVHALEHDNLKVIESLAPEQRLRLLRTLRVVLLVRLRHGKAYRLGDALELFGKSDARRVRGERRVEEVVQREGIAAAPAEASETDLRIGVRRTEVRDEAADLIYLRRAGVAQEERDPVEDEQGWQEEPLPPCSLVSVLGSGECPQR